MHACKFVEKAWLLLGAARKVVPISKKSTEKIQVKHDLGKRLYGGQCQNNKIGGAHLCHVGRNACMIIC